ncbi:MAG: class I SAM-dependent rRNA methyltransferase [Acidobacteriota bacterium]
MSPSPDKPPRLRLQKGRLKRVLSGHPWVFSNELQEVPPLEPGSLVHVDGPGGEPLGVGAYNPRTLIAVRWLARGADALPGDWLEARLAAAAARRDAVYPGEACARLVFGEADELPGLIVDRYGDTLAVQVLTAGMEALSDRLGAALRSLLNPRRIVWKNDAPSRELEGLRREVRWEPEGEAPEVSAEYLGLRFELDLGASQKTGLFLDQRENVRAFLKRLPPGADVLDVFCYRGAWGMAALRDGAASAAFVEASLSACQAVEKDLSRNGLPECEVHNGDAFDVLPALRRAGRSFDAVVCDPPAFAKSKKHLTEAEKAYRRLNELAFSLVRPGGLLVTCSCSYHVDRETFRTLVAEAAARSRRRAHLIEARGQAPDHPVLLGFPEGDYLKALFVRVL